ncbi:hypothetical protein ACFSTD_20110 [Novosphingobium colocasiae]
MRPFDELVGDEPQPARRPGQEIAACRPARPLAAGLHPCGDQPRTGQQQQRVGHAQPYVEAGPATREDLRLIAVAQRDEDEEQGEGEQVSGNEDPDPRLARDARAMVRLCRRYRHRIRCLHRAQ